MREIKAKIIAIYRILKSKWYLVLTEDKMIACYPKSNNLSYIKEIVAWLKKQEVKDE